MIPSVDSKAIKSVLLFIYFFAHRKDNSYVHSCPNRLWNVLPFIYYKPNLLSKQLELGSVTQP